MNEQQKFDYLIKIGYKADEDGNCFNHKGKLLFSVRKDGYIRFTKIINGKQEFFLNHRFVYYFFKQIIPKNIDHINRNKQDNSIENLRSVEQAENNVNKIGKGWRKRHNKYSAVIKVGEKYLHLGMFNTKEDAHTSYLVAKKYYHGVE